MTSPYAEHLEKIRRREILIAANANNYAISAEVAQLALNDQGITTSAAQTEEAFAWLENAACGRVEKIGSTVIFTLTREGRDIAEGTAAIDGIARPEPD